MKKTAAKRVVRKPKAAPPARKMSEIKKLTNALLRDFGTEVVWTPEREQEKIEVIPSLMILLNWALARGGLARGRIIEISGKESAGKTTTSLHFMRVVQKMGGVCAFLDAESSTDMKYLRQCGVKPGEQLIIMQPDFGEQALELVLRLVKSNLVDLIVVDSVAALVPKAELEGKMTDQQVGLLARIMAKNMRKLLPALRGSKTCVLFTNQLRDTIGGGGFGFGPKTSTPGGRALKHAASVRLSVTRTMPIKAGSREIGFLTKVKVVKNKLGQPNRVVQLPIIYRYGLDERLGLILAGEETGVLRKKAGAYYLDKRLVGKGWLAAYEKLTSNKKLLGYVKKRIETALVKRGDEGPEEEE
jgi:recombination protein RecA